MQICGVALIDKVGVRKEPVVITGPKGELRPDLRSKKVKVQFKISGYQASDVSVRIKGQRIECLESDGSYGFEYKPGANDITIKTTVYGNKKVLGEFTFTVKKAIQTRSGFDI